MPFSWELSKPVKYGIIIAASVGLSAAIVYKVYKHQRRRHYLQQFKPIEKEMVVVEEVERSPPDVIIDIPMQVIEETSNLVETGSNGESFEPESIAVASVDDSVIDDFIASKREPVEVDSLDDVFMEQKLHRKVLLLGLENSGKSSLLSQMSKEGNNCVKYEPTKGFNVVCISFENVDISIWEIGGGEQYRSYWKNFCSTTDLILYVVDSTTPDRFTQARKYFSEIIEDINDEIDFRIIATKSDLPESVSKDQIRDALGLDGTEWDILKVATKSGGAKENIGIDEIQSYCLTA